MSSNHLRSLVSNSDYLSALEAKYPELLEAINEGAPECIVSQLDNVFDLLDQIDPSDAFDLVESRLIALKARFAYLWALGELLQLQSFAQRGSLQTRFAEASLDIALQTSWFSIAQKHPQLRKAVEQSNGKIAGLFLFGMGKLGGGDLNFSSDVDLIGFFDPQVLPVPDALGKSYICHQVLQNLTKLVGQNGRADFIWRVDWRLRPNASATTLAMSTVAAHDYYYYRASPWHRLALMKARIVAGDYQSGHEFLNLITPFIWRQNLDYRALDELGEIKHKINLEHPGLKAQRHWREPISDDIRGFNVKLGSGGIREIEFIANALQLIWGGKHYPLRTPNTLRALSELHKASHLDQAAADNLTAAYEFLRRVENALQIVGNLQTHAIPSDPLSIEKLLRLLGVESLLELTEMLNQHRSRVSVDFEKLFAGHDEQDHEELEWPDELSTAAVDIVSGWEKGFIDYGVPIERRAKLKPLALAIAKYLAGAVEPSSTAKDANQIIIRLHEFFNTLPRGEQYFRLLAESPVLLQGIIPPLMYSPAMSTLLKQSPHIVDNLLSQASGTSDSFDSEFVLLADRYEIRLERARRFVNENLYQLYLYFLDGRFSASEFQLKLSLLAEHTIELCLQIVAENMDLSEIPIAVIGMGKVGMRRMAPLSDLDLIFVFDPGHCDLDLASKFVSRLQTAISAPMREGIVYELDTRLRPSGKSGAPTLTIDSFRTHQLSRAHTWEHIALVPSRVIAGSKDLKASIDKVKQEVVLGSRDKAQMKCDAWKMWSRISEHRVKELHTDIMFSKLRPGGLMQSEYLAACIILADDSTPSSFEFDDLLMHSTIGTEYDFLGENIQFWRVQQLWERLLGASEQPLNQLPADYLTRLLQQSEVASVEELIKKKNRFAKQTIRATQRFYEDSSAASLDLDSWQEKAVHWNKN